MRLRRWSTICVDFKGLFQNCYQQTLSFQSLLQVDVSATCAVKGLYLSNTKFTPYDAPQPMYIPPPPKVHAIPPNLITLYDWLEVGIEPVLAENKPTYMISNKDVFAQNTAYCVMLEKKATDFQKEADLYQANKDKQENL